MTSFRSPSLLRRTRVRLNISEPLVTSCNLPFSNWLHLIDPVRTPTVGQLAKSISQKWLSSKGKGILIVIDGYHIKPSETIDILRDDDVLEIVEFTSNSNMSMDVVTEMFSNRDETLEKPQANEAHERGIRKNSRNLSVHHADRSSCGGEDLEFKGGLEKGEREVKEARSSYEGENLEFTGGFEGGLNEASNKKRKAQELDISPSNGLKEKKTKRKKKKENWEDEVKELEEAVSSASSCVGYDQTKDGDGGEMEKEDEAVVETSGAEDQTLSNTVDCGSSKKKKRKRKHKKPATATGFDRKGRAAAGDVARKVPVELPNGKEGTHTVFGEEGGGEEGEVEDAAQNATDLEEEEEAEMSLEPKKMMTTDEEEEEEEGEANELEKEIANEDVEAWEPISAAPHEGSVIAFKVMEMDEHYCPQLSQFKVGTILNLSAGGERLVVKLHNFVRQKVKGKFEVRFKKAEDEEEEQLVTENEMRKKVAEMTLMWKNLMEPKMRP